LWLVSSSTSVLPFQIQDANNSILLDPNDEPKHEVIEVEDKKETNPKDKKKKKRKQTTHSKRR